ncbi:agmatine deiminase family protein [Mucilaginibacter calamicampi]|uniref:Agmatine deiminase family protein n=1 Tax=Mucilaginibacter calamicampi TaxID=1302352 RepID=A0ABW2Z1D6_9SPHI
MVNDTETNFLYLADTLPIKYPSFFKRLEALLIRCEVSYGLLPGTKDIWAVDYMPIQVGLEKFVQFSYNPSYLQGPKYADLITDSDKVCEQIGINPVKSTIVLDGGNVIRCDDKVIMTERIFKDNPNYDKDLLITQLRELLEVEHIYLIPEQPYDFTGHADGMVRFVDDNTILVNDYQRESKRFQQAFDAAIRKTGLDTIKVPYNPYDNKGTYSAVGDYINYLQMEDIAIVPTFGIAEDDAVVKLLESVFTNSKLVTIDASDIAKDGGVLNCISWNIRIDGSLKLIE